MSNNRIPDAYAIRTPGYLYSDEQGLCYPQQELVLDDDGELDAMAHGELELVGTQTVM